MNLVIFIFAFFFIFVSFMSHMVRKLLIGAVSGRCAVCETAHSSIRAVKWKAFECVFLVIILSSGV